MSNNDDVLITLASDMEDQGMETITPYGLRQLAHAAKAKHIMNQSGFDEFETIEDLNL